MADQEDFGYSSPADGPALAALRFSGLDAFTVGFLVPSIPRLGHLLYWQLKHPRHLAGNVPQFNESSLSDAWFATTSGFNSSS